MKSLTRNPIKKLLAVVTFVGAASTSVAAAPRTLANGAPAPGNTVAKGYTKRTSAERQLENARAQLVVALAEEKDAKYWLTSQPRTLPDGSPACGNTGGKAPECTVGMAEGMYQARIQRAHTAEVAVERAQLRLHEATRKVAQRNREVRSDDDDYS
jgi:hypothetical protein